LCGHAHVLPTAPKGYVLSFSSDSLGSSSSSKDFNVEQLAAARAKAWHQAGEPLLTLDAVRDWLTASGIVLFAPRTQQLPMPAPSLVEATLGASSGGPTDGQIDAAKALVARLVAEGNALPLNLLGIPGDLPDFVVSAQVFSFIFTMRGDKAWKLPPTTTGAIKVSPLSVRVYEVLAEKGAISAAEIATELGRELTESAVLRSLSELWSNLRVIPLLQQGEAVTLWELTSRRFTKAIKAGINAGQPTALSALISLYLAQALLATEDEVETFLSPLAARSRIREVLHALTGSRQLETIVLEGKMLLHIPGTLPEFPAIEKPEPTEEEIAAAAELAAAAAEGEGRIKKFSSSSERRAFGDFKGKPAKNFGSGPSRLGARTARPSAGGMRPAFGRSAAGKPDGERRPFRRDAAAGDKPSFTKPWSEDRKPRAEGDAPKRPYVKREGAEGGSSFAKRPYTPREGGSDRPSFGGDRPSYGAKRSFDKPAFGAKRPYTPREGGSDRPARPYAPREGGGDRPSFGAKRTFGDKPAFGAKRPYTPREGGSDRPARPYTPREGGSDRPSFGGDRPAYGAKRSFDKPAFRKPAFGGSEGGERKPYERKPFVKREGFEGGERPRRDFAAGASRPDSFSKFRKTEGFKKPFTPREGDSERPAYGGSDSKPRAPKEPRAERPEGSPKRPFPRKEGDLADRPVRPWPEAPVKQGRSDGRPGGYGSKPRAPRAPREDGDRPARPSFGGKKTFDGKPAGDRPRSSFGDRPRPAGGGFSKRPAGVGGKVPFGSKPSFGKRPGGAGGFKPATRKPKPETGE